MKIKNKDVIKTERKQEIITLPNGTRIILEEDFTVRSCSMSVHIASGSRYETPETAGASHFIEHMLFKGTEKRNARQIAEEIDEIGGMLNAFTAKEYTCVYTRCLGEHANEAFEIIADMITSPKLSPEDIELEKGVILEEISMYEDSPEDLCADIFYENVWASDMLGSNILGTRETVNAMSREILLEHMKKFYVPERTVISFCGNFERESLLNLCSEHFGKAENTGNPISVGEVKYHQNITTLKKDFEQNQLIFGFPGFERGSKKARAVHLLASILGEASSSKLFQRIREELGLAYSVDCANAAYLNAGVFIVTMGVSQKSEKKAIREAFRIIASFADTVTEKELFRAKEQAVAGLLMGLESVVARDSHNGRELMFGMLKSAEEIENQIKAVTLEDIKAVAQEIFDFGKMSLCAAGRVHGKTYYKKELEQTLREETDEQLQ